MTRQGERRRNFEGLANCKRGGGVAKSGVLSFTRRETAL